MTSVMWPSWIQLTCSTFPCGCEVLSSHSSKTEHLPYTFIEELLSPLFLLVVRSRNRYWLQRCTAPIPLAWCLHNVSTVKYLVYADNLTVWSTHHDLPNEVSALQLALDVTRDFASSVCLQLSTRKTPYTSVSNRWGRRKLAACPMRLQVAGQSLQKSPTIKVLGLMVHQSGTETAWLAYTKTPGLPKSDTGVPYRSQSQWSLLACRMTASKGSLTTVPWLLSPVPAFHENAIGSTGSHQ